MRRGRMILLAGLLVCAAMGQGVDESNQQDDWADTIRFVIDAVNVAFLIHQHCGPSATTNQCGSAVVLVLVTTVIVLLAGKLCSVLGVRIGESPTDKKRQQMCLDGLRAATLASNLNDLRH